MSENNLSPFPDLTINDQYSLREQFESDAADFLAYYSDQDVCQHILADIPNTLEKAQYEIEYCRQLYYSHRGIYWAIAEIKSNRMIGAIGVYFKEKQHVAEICYDLNKQYWRKGIAYAAMCTAIDYLKSQPRFTELQALTMKQNQASNKLLEKIGFRYHTTLPSHRHFQGHWHDVELYKLLF
jgi:[ribosomal protein S5]-alanine N-acetyltransferase